ncbi:MAG: putative sigma-54 modulation protein [Bradymonadia bacterium]|jgi:putative sigma-54 modulation protein
MEPSEAVHKYATDKLQHVVSKFVHGQDVTASAVFAVERYLHIANFTININGLTLKSVEKTEDMYEAIDLALEKVERQMRRYKAKIRSHRPDQRRRPFTMQVVSIPDAEEEEEVEDTALEDYIEDTVETLKAETHEAGYMTLQEAIMQLELRASQFLVFTNKEHERINILYRRDDGNFGLIEAEPPN